MGIDRIVSPTQQHRYIDPYEMRISEWGTAESDVVISRAANSIYNIFGNDIVLSCYDYSNYQKVFTDEDVLVTVPGLQLIQDTTLIDITSDTTVVFENLSGLNSNGYLVVYIKYQFLNTTEQNLAYVCINYISSNGTARIGWDHNKDRTVVGILEFTKDNNDNIINLQFSSKKSILIEGKTYYLFGFNPNLSRKPLLPYLVQLLYKSTGSSISIDNNGISLIGDTAELGPYMYYGTGENEERGYHPFPSDWDGNPLYFIQLKDTPNNYIDNECKFVRVKKDRSGLEFVRLPEFDNMMVTDLDQTVSSNKIFEKDVWILGNCVVKGDLIEINRETINVANNEIVLNTNEIGNGISSVYSGIRVKRGTLPDALLRFNENIDKWQVGIDGQYPYDTLLTSDCLNIIDDEGVTTKFAGKTYKMKMIDGNLYMNEVDSCMGV